MWSPDEMRIQLGDKKGQKIKDLIPKSSHYAGTEERMGKFNADLYAILSEKTEGEVAERVAVVQQDEGMLALWKLIDWHLRTTGIRIEDRKRELMHPKEVNKDEEIQPAIEKFEQEIMELATATRGYPQ